MVAAAALATLAGCSWSFKSDNIKMKFNDRRLTPGTRHTDDRGCVLGASRARAEGNGKAGIDLSSATRDGLRLSGKDPVEWRLVPARDVAAGPRKRVAAPSRTAGS